MISVALSSHQWLLRALRSVISPCPDGRFITCLPLLLLPLAVPAQTPAPGDAATVAGRVVLRGEPARGVEVALYPPQTISNVVVGAQRTKTDADGRFAFAGVATGTYTLRSLAPGFVVPNESSYRPGKQLTVGRGDKIDDLVLELKPGGVLTGRVQDAQGRPVVAQSVQLKSINEAGKPQFFYPSNQFWEMAMTDDRGVYRIFGLPAGRYLVYCGTEIQPGSLHLSNNASFRNAVFYPNAPTEAQAKPVVVVEGAVVENIDLTLGEAKKTYQIFGQVIEGETGRPVPGVELAYGSALAGNAGMGSFGTKGERTNAQGEFVLANVLPGRYGIWTGSYDDQNEWIGDPTICEVTDEDVSGVVVKVARAATISGVVVLDAGVDASLRAPFNGANVVSFTQSSIGRRDPHRISKVGADGSFQLKGVAAGKAHLSLNIPTVLKGLSVSRVERDGAPLPNGDLEVAQGEKVTGLRFIVGFGTGKLRGQIKVAGGRLPEGLAFFIVAENVADASGVNKGSATVDERGQFLLENLQPGNYRLALSAWASKPTVEKAFVERLNALLKTISAQAAVTNGAEATAMLTVDLSQMEGK